MVCVDVQRLEHAALHTHSKAGALNIHKRKHINRKSTALTVSIIDCERVRVNIVTLGIHLVIMN